MQKPTKKQKELNRLQMIPPILYLFDDKKIPKSHIIRDSGLPKLNHVFKRHSLLSDMSFDDLSKLYELAMKKVDNKIIAYEQMIEEEIDKEVSRQAMIHTILFLLDDCSIAEGDILKNTGLSSSLIPIFKKHSLLCTLPYKHLKKVYDYAIKTIGEKPTREEMFVVVKNLFKRDIKQQEVQAVTGVSHYYYHVSNQTSRMRYDTLFRLYKYELRLQRDELYSKEKKKEMSSSI
ncbi:TPA: hypothetical protein NJO02_001317 [Staphylococcus pseudintermedius]|nr:hypothetical protein [Staphylococcus pseudintermedius]HCG2162466.1 hypothetical protein [Staphylococcus pseudintermedius]HCG2212017.1 hypothetical protein [Staphylococcus pseudintermedius]